MDRSELRARLEREKRWRTLHNYVADTLPGYVGGWWMERLCGILQDVSQRVQSGSTAPRVLISCPPGHGKSSVIAQRWPVWQMRFPRQEIILATYSQDLANDHSGTAREVRDLTREQWPGLVPHKNKPDRVNNWVTRNGSTFRAVGVGGPVTGRRAHLFIIDDYLKDSAEAASPAKRRAIWDWYASTARSRLYPQSAVVILATRWHEDDLIGRLLRKQPDLWEVYSFAAIAPRDEAYRKAGEALHPERWPLDFMERTREEVGSRFWSSLYQQDPIPVGGMIFRSDWLRTFSGRPEDVARECDELILTADLTDTIEEHTGDRRDWSAWQIWGRRRGCFLLLYAERNQDGLLFNYAVGKRLYNKWRPHATYLEMKRHGRSLFELLHDEITGLMPITPRESKIVRAERQTAVFEGGRVYLPDEREAPWRAEYEAEILSFPGGLHDDQVDATTQGLEQLRDYHSADGFAVGAVS